MSSQDSYRRHPEYLIIDKLPGSEIPLLLGRIVANPRSVTDDYRPEDPRPALNGKYLELFDKDFSTLFSASTNEKAKASVSRVLGFDVNKEDSTSTRQTAKFVRTRILPQHRDVLEALLEHHRPAVLKLLGDNRKTGYMIVGIKSALDGQQSRKRHSGSKKRLRLNLPTGAVVNAASHGTVDIGDNADLIIDAGVENAWSGSSKSNLVGEQVFAVRYRRITLRTAFLSEKVKDVKLGDAVWTRGDDGVFGDQEREEITEDDEDDVEDEGLGDVEDSLAGGVDLHTDPSTFKEIWSDNIQYIEDEDDER